MKVAFLIQAHACPEMLARLVCRLSGHGDIFIHIDARSDLRPFTERVDRRAQFIAHRSRVHWGGRSQLEAYMCLLEAAAVKNYDYYSLHSGMDYPCRPLLEYLAFLRDNQGQEFIDSAPMPENFKIRYRKRFLTDFYPTIARNTLRDKAVNLLERVVCKILPQRGEFQGWLSYLGANWCTLSHGFITSALNYWRTRPDLRRYVLFFQSPDEWFMQTYGQMAGFAAKFSQHGNLRYVDWSAQGSHPAVLLDKDYAEIVRSKAFFARKMAPESEKLLDMLDERIGYA